MLRKNKIQKVDEISNQKIDIVTKIYSALENNNDFEEIRSLLKKYN